MRDRRRLTGSRILAALTLAAALGLVGAAGVYAAPAIQEKPEAETMEHAALVMLKEPAAGNKRTLKNRLRTGAKKVSDIRVQELWTFQEGDGSAGAQKKVLKKGDSAEEDSRSVALVTSEDLSTETLVKTLQGRDDVLYAEANFRVHTLAVTNDPYFTKQWSLAGGASASAYSEYTPNVPAVWDAAGGGATGSDRIVALVDTGVDYTHPDLAGQMWKNRHYPDLKGSCGFDFLNGDDDPMDDNGHGTHCAGIMGARGNNGIGISGINQKIRIMALKGFDAEGSAWLSHEIAAYDYINKAMDLGEPVQAVNNSWGGGAENYSAIFEELINITGKKGAVSVFAAGNETSDNDKIPVYPANIDSPYAISVAATTEAGELASFSNYGENTVQTAAPGIDILSTISYPVYNPTIYGAQEQEKLTASFNDYEASGGWESVEESSRNLYVNNKAVPGGNDRVKVSLAKEGFSGKPGKREASGHSLCLEAGKLQTEDMVCLSIPYEIEKDSEMAPCFSAMIKTLGSFDEQGLLVVGDMQRDQAITDLDHLNLIGYNDIFSSYDDYWSHFSGRTMGEDAFAEMKKEAEKRREGQPDPLKRKIVILIYAQMGGSAKVWMDDLGLSKQDIEMSDFGRYEYLSGTSMAAPYVTGALALYAQAVEYPRLTDTSDLAGGLLSMVKDQHLPLVTGGMLDFTQKPVEQGPRIASIKVDKARGIITIQGSGLNPSSGLKVEMARTGEPLQEAVVTSKSDKKITVKDQGWINNRVDICLTGAGGKTSKKANLYLVGGKKTYRTVADVDDKTSGEAMATDGRHIYHVSSLAGTVAEQDAGNLTKGASYLATLDAVGLFGKSKERLGTSLRFGKDLVYLNGKLYTVVEYGAADQTESDLMEGGMVVYASDFRLVSIDVNTCKVTNLGKLPAGLKTVQDYTMCAYNGKLYFLGGYSHTSDGPIKTVRTYDPAKKSGKWGTAKALPRARGGGKALQCGRYLVYTMGYSRPLDEENTAMPENLIFDGNNWKVSKGADTPKPLDFPATVMRGNRLYPLYQATIGVTKAGLVYTGMPVEDLGDTFEYNISKDTYTDTGYNFLHNEWIQSQVRGIAVGAKLFGFDGANVYTAALPSGSGLFSVRVNKNTGGTVSGKTSLPAGNSTTLTISAKKGYVIKSIALDGRSVKVKNKSRQKVTVSNVTANRTLTVRFQKKKK